MKIGRLNIDGPWKLHVPIQEALLGFDFDGDDEDGDPSGLHVCILGWSLGIYWPTHWRIMVSWSLGGNLRVARW